VVKATWTDDLHHSGAAIRDRHEKAWTEDDGERAIMTWIAHIDNTPGTPLDLCVPSLVKNKDLTFLQPLLFCIIARVVFSPALKIYLAESKVNTTDGSVSEERAV